MLNQYGIFQSLIESEDKSTLKTDFKKKKQSSKLKFIELKDNMDADIKRYGCLQRNIDWLNMVKKDHDKGEIVIDEDQDRIAGYIFIENSKKYKNLISPLFIFEEYRGQGLSNRLVNDAVHKYGGDNLKVYSDNEVAIALYKKYGFRVYKTRKVRNSKEKWLYMTTRKDIETESSVKDEFCQFI